MDRAAVDVTEAAVLSGREEDEAFDAVVTSVRHAAATVQPRDPAVIATVHDGALVAGTSVRIRLDAADLDGPAVQFSRVR